MLAILGFFLIFLIPFSAALPYGRWNADRADATLTRGWRHWRSSASVARVSTASAAVGPASTTVAVSKDPAKTTPVSQAPAKTTPVSKAPAASTASAAAIAGDKVLVAAAPKKNLWQPAVGAKWQIVLSKQIKIDSTGAVSPNADIYDVDLFDTPTETISNLHKAGKKVICYFSAGSYEDWREDKGEWNTADLGNNLDGWPGERWANIKAASVRNVMKSRIALAASKRCDAIDPDNVDGYDNNNGLGLKPADSADFVKFLAAEAAKLGMSAGLKNSADIVPNVLSAVQFCVNEDCGELGECDLFQPFIAAGKPVFNIEYPGNSEANDFAQSSAGQASCAAAKDSQFSTVIKTMDLDGFVRYCDGSTATTATV